MVLINKNKIVKKSVDVVSNKGSGWFYTDEVKEHFFHPKNFMSPEEEKNYKADGRGMVGSPACGDMMSVWIKIDKENDKIIDFKWRTFGSLLPDAKIMLDDFTFRKVKDITLGDKIIDGESKINFVEEVFVRSYEGKVINIRLSSSKYYDFSVTPNHPIPIIKRRDVALIQRRPGTRWCEVSQKKIDKSEVKIVSAGDLEEGDFLLYNFPNDVKDNKNLSLDVCTLLGYYVSDGSSPSKNRIIFNFGLNEEDYVREIEDIAKKNKWGYKIFKRNTENVLCIQINSSKLASLMIMHGGRPSHKKFSDEAILLPKKKQEKIIDSYIKGDGWELNQDENWEIQYFISTSKEEIANQLQIMVARQGIFAPIHVRPGREFVIRGKTYRNSGEINLIFRKNVSYSRIKFKKDISSFLIPISKLEVRKYNGKIYDPGIVYEPKIYKVNGISFHNCASAIAATSILSVMVTENGGMKIDEAMKIKPQDIVARLGSLPARKFHCSVLGDKALRSAINNYFKKNDMKERVVEENARLIDKNTGTTDHDIEEAVLEGADTLEKVQKKLKVGIGNKACIPEVEQLIRFYKEKYFGLE